MNAFFISGENNYHWFRDEDSSQMNLLRANSLTSKTKYISKNILVSFQKSLFTITAVSITLLPFMAARAQAASIADSIKGFTQKLQNKDQSPMIDPNVINIEKFEPKQTEVKEKRTTPEEITNTAEILEAAEFASKETGVRKEFLIGMLVVESNLGQNTGKCTYREVAQGAENAYKNGNLTPKAWGTFQQRKQQIKGIADSLGYNYEDVKVSCNPSGYAGTGGALGVPQFMPDTWLDYKDEISRIVGKDNPDPWNARDGVVAMAVKLADVNGVTEHNSLAERNAAKMYLSGTTHWQYDWYANQIFFWSQHYKELVG